LAKRRRQMLANQLPLQKPTQLQYKTQYSPGK